MRLGFPVLLALLALLATPLLALSIDDEASFWALSGEKAGFVPLVVENQNYFLIVADAKPVALLIPQGGGYATLDDVALMESVLAQYVAAGFPSVLLAAEDGRLAPPLRTEELRRYPSARRSQLTFERDALVRAAEARRNEMFRQYNALRSVSFDSLDEDLTFLESTVEDMRASHSLDAAEKFAGRFDERVPDATRKLQNLEDVADAHEAAAEALENASLAIARARVRFGTDSPLVQQLDRDSLAAGYELSSLEALIGGGKSVTADDFVGPTQAGFDLQRRALNIRETPWGFYLFLVVVLVLLASGGTWFYRKYRPRNAQEALSAGQKIVKRIRLFEEKQEKEQQEQDQKG